MKDLFRECGAVHRADILMNHEGKSKGQGIVVFETEEAAAQAIKQFDKADYKGRTLQVHEDRLAKSF